MKQVLKKVSDFALGRLKKPDKKSDFQIFNDDIFLVSYPKSGNTWLRFLIGNYLTENKCDFTNSHLIVPDIHFNPEQISQIQKPRFLKSHQPFTSDYSKVVYLVRDGRDVAVSYYFHLKKYGQISNETEFKDYISDFNSGCIDGFSSWSNHVKSWLDNAPDNFLLVKYEELKNNPVDTLTRIIGFAEIEFSHQKIVDAIEASRFDKMRNLENSQHNLFKGLVNSDRNISFVRSGRTGEWKKFFTDELAEDFIATHGSALTRLCYL